jgi:hypothetical protein
MATTDLDLLTPEEDGGSFPSPAMPTVRPMWIPYAALALGAVATIAIVVGAWNLREQARMMRHEQCFQDTQILSARPLGGQQGLPQGIPPLAQCFSGPTKARFLGTVVVPGLVGLQANDAEQDLQLLGLLFAERGPTPGIVVAQSPALGTSVPAGSMVTLTLRAP